MPTLTLEVPDNYYQRLLVVGEQDPARGAVRAIRAGLAAMDAPTRPQPIAPADRRPHVIKRVREGARNAEIAAELGLSTPRVSQLIAEAVAAGDLAPDHRRAGRPRQNAERDAAISNAVAQGLSRAAVALSHGLSLARVDQIVARAAKEQK